MQGRCTPLTVSCAAFPDQAQLTLHSTVLIGGCLFAVGDWQGQGQGARDFPEAHVILHASTAQWPPAQPSRSDCSFLRHPTFLQKDKVSQSFKRSAQFLYMTLEHFDRVYCEKGTRINCPRLHKLACSVKNSKSSSKSFIACRGYREASSSREGDRAAASLGAAAWFSPSSGCRSGPA